MDRIVMKFLRFMTTTTLGALATGYLLGGFIALCVGPWFLVSGAIGVAVGALTREWLDKWMGGE